MKRLANDRSRRRSTGQTDPYVLSLDWAPHLIRQKQGQEEGLLLNAYAIYIFRLVGAQKNNNVYLIKVFVQIYLKKNGNAQWCTHYSGAYFVEVVSQQIQRNFLCFM